METVGRFEFNRKDLIGHGAFAVVFKGRHIEKRDVEVAIKCINKKNLAKSQSLLGKEIKILKELKHENIVGLLDYQEIGGCVYLVMEYCNGGDLAEYLQARRTLSEDTIRVFLQQIARAMWVLQSRGILHRDLKPQNILLCHPEGRRSSLNNTCVKIADFGFARHLQTNTMAVTLCGSPMYMAPEVIMSQNYDAKADLWSIGTVVYQCLTGKAPFYASTPQELRLFYEGNEKLLPSIPRETSSHLRHLLLGLLQRNHKERMAFDEFFTHPFLEPSPSPKSSPVPMIPSYPSSSSASGSASGSCCSGSSNSNQPSPQHSDEEMYRLQPNVLQPPMQRAPGAPLKDTANQDSGTDSAHTEDFVMVPVQFPNEYTDEMGDVSPLEESLIYSSHSPRPERDPGLAGTTPPFTSLHSLTQPSSKTVELSGNPYHQAVPIPVPTQIHNYQRIEQNLQPAGLHGSTRARLCCAGSCNRLSPAGRSGEAQTCHGSTLGSQRLQTGGHQTLQSSPRVRVTSVMSEQVCPLGTGTGSPAGSGRVQNSLSPMNNERRKNTDPQIHKTSPNLQAHRTFPSPPDDLHWPKDNRKGTVKRSWSTGRLSDMLLRAAFGTQLLQGDICESPGSEKGMVDTAESPGYRDSAWFFGSPSLQRRPRMERPRRESDSEVMDATPQCSLEFHPPELPVDSLMEQAHTNALMDLRFALAFVHCVMEVASSKDPGLEDSSSPDVSFLQQSLVTDQISLLSSEWSHAEQLVLYMKSEEFLSSALHTAKEDIKAGRLLPLATVKQVIRKLNELYKACVGYCRSLSHRLQGFLLDKQRLIDRFNGIAAEKLIYNHTVHMVQSAALDEMFHCSTTSIQRYIKGLLLMEGLCRIITEPQDINSIAKCKWCIERRLTALQRVPYP